MLEWDTTDIFDGLEMCPGWIPASHLAEADKDSAGEECLTVNRWMENNGPPRNDRNLHVWRSPDVTNTVGVVQHWSAQLSKASTSGLSRSSETSCLTDRLGIKSYRWRGCGQPRHGNSSIVSPLFISIVISKAAAWSDRDQYFCWFKEKEDVRIAYRPSVRTETKLQKFLIW